MSEAAADRPSGDASALREEAAALGDRLAGLIDDPETFVAALRAGLERLSDEGYAHMPVHRSATSGPVLGVRLSLQGAIRRRLEPALREGSGASALWLAQRLVGEEVREVRLFALPALARSLPEDPERTWQALRRLGRTARDWVEVDSQAHAWAEGVLAEPFRWAELEQLVYSARPMERRLVGATLACMPHAVPRTFRGRLASETAPRAMSLARDLIGDAEPLVRKALSWALREWARVDAAAVERVARDETAIAVEHADGHRARVVRDTLPALPPGVGAELRARLAGIRVRPGSPSTSPAARRATAFGPLPDLGDALAVRQGARFRGGER
jgi:hypothetical protein